MSERRRKPMTSQPLSAVFAAGCQRALRRWALASR